MNTSRIAIEHLTEHFKDAYPDLIRQALALVDQVERPDNCRRPRGVEVAQILLELRVDAETVLAAILSDPVFNDVRPDYDFKSCFGETVSALIQDVIWLNRLRVYSADMADQPEQPEILRRMLLSVIRDVRSVLIKLAYRIQRLRQLAGEEYEVRRYISRESLDVYAPLANRLGVSQLKWELEDLAFRYLQPQSYVKLVKSLSATRIQREACINQFIAMLTETLGQEEINAKIAGRPKHLYSIWKKMLRKQLSIDELYDLLAVRVIVDKLTTCYAVLGIVHAQWQYIPKEFDDYIANPKANGYQSLHTVVLDPQGHRIEVQIRTKEMHEFAELGVAAHWRYKEGGQHSAAVDKSIASLRRLMEDKEGDEQLLEGFKTELYYDRVYVLTPAGKLVDLVKGSTPLDFAYAVHTEVGHRCRGAKVNGRIVPLTYPLQTGERVEILTAKEGLPNRQWLDNNLGYLKSPRAITKVKSWLRQQSLEQNQDAGQKIIDKLLVQWGRQANDIVLVLKHFNLSSVDRLLELVGRGDITPVQLEHVFKKPVALGSRNKSPKPAKGEILVDGVRNLATKTAQCCNPKPGDDIIGYITHRSGITIHRQQCENIVHLSEQKQTQLVKVSWAERPS
jgi:GTP pyrophosphokinase